LGRSTEARLGEILKGCLTDLIADLGATPTPGTDVLAEARKRSKGGRGPIGAVIGFSNADLRGTLTLVGDRRLFARLFPSDAGMPSGPPDVLDWAREFANLAVGKFRNRACAHGVSVQLSCPRSLSREEIAALESRRATAPASWVIGIEDMRFQAWLAMDFTAPVTLTDAPMDLGLDEGFVLMLSQDGQAP
jgi:hypothetical protein